MSEQERRQQREQQREQQIKAENLSARIRAAAQPDRIDPAIGRTYGDAAARGMYDDASRLRDFREMCDRNRQHRAAANQHRVCDILAARDPQYAQTIERAVRDLSPRSRTRESR